MDTAALTNDAQLNARRLWTDPSIRHAFQGFVAVLVFQRAGVVCIQKTHAREFHDIPNDLSFTYDRPAGRVWRQVGVFFHEAVSVTNILGIVCPSLYKPPCKRGRRHSRPCVAGSRGVHSAHVVSILRRSTLIMSGDANVRLSHFSLGRVRPRDTAIFPLR